MRSPAFSDPGRRHWFRSDGDQPAVFEGHGALVAVDHSQPDVVQHLVGAMLTHEALVSSMENVLRCRGLDPAARNTTLISVPLFHVTGCCSQMVTQVRIGGPAC